VFIPVVYTMIQLLIYTTCGVCGVLLATFYFMRAVTYVASSNSSSAQRALRSDHVAAKVLLSATACMRTMRNTVNDIIIVQ